MERSYISPTSPIHLPHISQELEREMERAQVAHADEVSDLEQARSNPNPNLNPNPNPNPNQATSPSPYGSASALVLSSVCSKT